MTETVRTDGKPRIGVLALQGGPELLTVAQVSRQESDAIQVEVGAVAERLVVDDGDVVAAVAGQVVGEVDADEPGTAGDEHVAHVAPLEPPPEVGTTHEASGAS